MTPDLEAILNYQPGWGSMERVGLAPDGSRQVQQFSHASAMGCLFARSRYWATFGKLIPRYVDQYHPVIIAKLCSYACRQGIDLETLLAGMEPGNDN